MLIIMVSFLLALCEVGGVYQGKQAGEAEGR